MVEEDIPRLYGERAKDVVFHMDSAPAHTSKKTIQWLKSNNVSGFLKRIGWQIHQIWRLWTTEYTRM